MVLAVFAMGYNLAFGYTGLLSPRPRALLRRRPLRHRPPRRQRRRGRQRRASRRDRRRRRLAGAARAPRAPHHRRRLHDRDADVRPGGVAHDPLFRPDHPRRRGLHPAPRRARPSGRSTSPPTSRATRSPSSSSPSASSPASRSCAPHRPRARRVRENAERTRMLGYDPFRARLLALTVSGLYAGAAGAPTASSSATSARASRAVQYSILPLLWVLLGGAGTVLGPFVGTRADVLPRRPRRAGHRRDAPRRRARAASSSCSSRRAASSARCARALPWLP